MADNNEQFRFDLDARDFLGKLDEIRGQVLSIGDSKNLSGLVQGFVRLAGPIAAVGAALLAVKTAFNLAEEGAQIEKIHKQFDSFASSIGINSVEMKKNIQAAIGTTEDLEDALKSSTKAMSMLGDNSDKIPQMFDIAKKAAAAYGGTMQEHFDRISMAISTGNTRMLRQSGIIVDAEKAMKTYAASIGTVSSALNEQGRQSAVAMAVFEKADKTLKSVKTEQEGIITSSKRFKQAWNELGDSVAVAMNKAFGPAFSKALEYFSKLLGDVSDKLKSNFGSGVEAADAKVRVLEKSLAEMNETMTNARKTGFMYGAVADKGDFVRLQKQIDDANASLIANKALSKELEEEARRKASAEKGEKIIAEGGPASVVDDKKSLDQKSKFNLELLRLSEQRVKSELEVETDADAHYLLLVQERNNKIAQYDAQIAQIKAQGAAGDTITAQQANDMIVQIEAEKAAKIEAINRDMDKEQLKVYDNKVKAAKTASEGISSAFAQGAAQAQYSMKDYGKQGQMVFGTLTKNAASAFRALGDGSKSAGDAMKGFLLGSIADIAEAQGQFLLSSGIGTMNPVQIAEGGALIALAGLLRSQAGEAGGGGGGGYSGGSGGGGAPSSGPSMISEKPELQDEKKKAVTVQIMGHYFETEQTQNRLLEMIRSSTDATDFRYQQIGVGGK